MKDGVINIFAGYLGQFTQKTDLLNRALIKLAIKDLYTDKTAEALSYSEWKQVITQSLKNRMDKIPSLNSSEVIIGLLNQLDDHQSLISMSNI